MGQLVLLADTELEYTHTASIMLMQRQVGQDIVIAVVAAYNLELCDYKMTVCIFSCSYTSASFFKHFSVH